MEQFTQLGISGFTLLILFFVVKYFVSAMQAKDQQLENKNIQIGSIIEKFNTTINNHLSHEQQALENLTSVIRDLSLEIKGNNQRRRDNDR